MLLLLHKVWNSAHRQKQKSIGTGKCLLEHAFAILLKLHRDFVYCYAMQNVSNAYYYTIVYFSTVHLQCAVLKSDAKHKIVKRLLKCNSKHTHVVH